MPTKKSTKKRSSKEQTGSNGGAKKQGSKRLNGRKRQQQIPPVVVGGGSVLVWIIKGLNLTQLGTPPNVTYLNPQMYNCYQVGAASDVLTNVVVNRGQGGPVNPPPVLLNRGNFTKFN